MAATTFVLSNCLQLRNQHPSRLQGFATKATFRCELVRGDDAFIHFIEQELTERLDLTKGFVDDRERAG